MKNQIFKLPAFVTSEFFILSLIIFIAFIVRLYRIQYPLADWHSFRQADTASVTREYVKNGIDLLRPKYHDLSNIQSGERTGGQDNVEGWRMVEFPFINAMIASVLRTFPFLSLVVTSRLFSILFSLGTLLSLYLLVKKHSDTSVAQLTAITFAILPYSIFYSRVILPEPFMLFFSTFSILSFTYWSQRKSEWWLILSAVSLALALLLKPFVIFLAPVYGVLTLQRCNFVTLHENKYRVLVIIGLKLLAFVLFAFAPLLMWRNWISQFPSGIPASDWLFNSNGIRFRPAWFRWLGYERLTKLFLGYSGMLFLIFGLLPFDVKSKVKSLKLTILNILHTPYTILFAWWIGILAYFIVFATGNVQHDYYQNLMIPIVCWTIGLGIKNFYFHILKWLENFKIKYSRQIVAQSIIIVISGMSWVFAWQQVKGYFNVNNWEYIEAGKVVDQLTPPNAKVIAPAMGDTVFLFQTNRTGWPIGFDIDKKISEGANYYVTTTYDDEARALEAKYETVEKTDKYLILHLNSIKE